MSAEYSKKPPTLSKLDDYSENENNDDVKLKMIDGMKSENSIEKAEKIEFSGLEKWEVLQYANNPKWVRIRWILFALFWAIWIGMLLIAVLLIVFTQKCPHRPKLKWHQRDVAYQVDVGKFRDSDGDGIGDFNGLTEKLPYLRELGAKTICLNDIFVSNAGIKPEFGDETSIEKLMKALKPYDMHLILDINGHREKSFVEKYMNIVDGIRITNAISSLLNSSPSTMSEYVEKSKKAGDDSIKDLYMAFYPLTNEDANITSPTTIYNTVLADARNTEVFMGQIAKDSDSNHTQTWMTGVFGQQQEQLKDNLTRSDLIRALSLLLKGNTMILYGDEIGLSSGSNMQWNKERGCGFTTNNKTDFTQMSCEPNVNQQKASGMGETIFDLYVHLIKLRKEPSFQWGRFQTKFFHPQIISFVRQAEGYDGYLVVANVGTTGKVLSNGLHTLYEGVADTANVTYAFPTNRNHDDYKIDNVVSTHGINLEAGEMIVLKLKKVGQADKLGLF